MRDSVMLSPVNDYGLGEAMSRGDCGDILAGYFCSKAGFYLFAYSHSLERISSA